MKIVRGMPNSAKNIVPVQCVRCVQIQPDGGSAGVMLPLPCSACVGGRVVQLELPGLGMPTTSALPAAHHLTLLGAQLVADHPSHDGLGEGLRPVHAHRST